jgi:hypothetical protein
VEGALGHIPINSLRNPKQIVQVSTPAASITDSPKPITPRSVQLMILRSIEAIYAHVMGIDQLYRQWELARNRGTQISADQQTQWYILLPSISFAYFMYLFSLSRNTEYTVLVRELWKELLVQPETGAATTESTSVAATLSQTPSDLTLARMLSFSKGRRVVGRVIRFLPRNQVLNLLKAVFVSLKSIALTSTDPIAVLAELEEYANWVVFAFVPVIAEASMDVVLDCLQAVIASGEVVQIARTKVCHTRASLKKHVILYLVHFSPASCF